MQTIWKIGTAAVAVAVLGGFFVGRVVAGESPLPEVGDPVTVGSTASPSPTASTDTPTLRPRGDRTREERPRSPGDDRTREDEHGDDSRGPGSADDDSGPGSDDDGRGRGRGRGRGGDDGDDDDVRTVGPSPSVVSPDDDDDRGEDDDDDDDDGGDDD